MKKLTTLILATSMSSILLAETYNTTTDATKVYQTIDCFGASDAWSGAFIGKWENARDDAARMLFSTKFDDCGNPEGIGLTMWRFNMGGGSFEQGEASNIQPKKQRRAESFFDKDGKLDFSKAAGQQYLMKKAREYGCTDFVLFSNTPPVNMTKNGYGFSSDPNTANLQEDKYDDFAEYMVSIAQYFTKQGYNIAFISPCNEPQVSWTKTYQEGTGWNNSEIKRIVVELDKALTKRKLDNTMIMISESGRMQCLYNIDEAVKIRVDTVNEKYKKDLKIDRKEIPGKQIQAFFDPKSPFYVGDLKHMPKIIAGHEYRSDFTVEHIINIRKPVPAETEKYGVKFWQTEWVFVPQYDGVKTNDIMDPNNYDHMDIAIWMARVIHGDFTIAGARSWQYWKAMEMYKTGGPALIDGYPINNGDVEGGGAVEATKILWGMGNYSFFIRPNFKRIDLTGAEDLKKVFGSAYISPDGKRIVQVYVNPTYEKHTVNAEIKNWGDIKKVQVFRTDQRNDLANTHADEKSTQITITPRSITTVVLDK